VTLQDEGIHPALAGLLDVTVTPQVKHVRKRGGFGAACGSYEGQMLSMPIGITCVECLKLRRVRT
jgi:hypothetical protein